jgi:DNA-directed RNA polymerase subunit omega
MNPELCRLALAKVVNPNVLVNLVSRRVRQLNSGGGGKNRPLIANPGNMGAADIALMEIAEDKMGWEMAETSVLVEAVKPKKRKKG